MDSGILRRLAIAPIRAYQYLVSPWLGHRCRFDPSCSQYAVQAIHHYGFLRGSCLAGWRLLKCHPLHPGGADPVPGCEPPHPANSESASRHIFHLS